MLAAVPAWAQTAAGGAVHTIILKSDGTVWTVGGNTNGQLGDNTTTQRKSPIQVSGLSGVVAVAAGAQHSMALTSTGALYVWGDNAFGQVGDNSTTDRKTPVQSSLTNIVAIAAGEYHSVARSASGEVFTWGKNTSGQLGDGTTTSPVKVPASVMTGVAAIGAGFNHTLFVKTDGTVYASGSNSNGQLGDGSTPSTTARSTPVPMSGISTATMAVGGLKHSVMLLSNGTLMSTGYNAQGQLGDTTTTQRGSPVSVANLTNITAIAGGSDHTLARESDSTVWAWGFNTSGQVGDGTTTSPRSTPLELTSISAITKIGAGHYHSMAVNSSGVVYTWGYNASYQLGDGTNDDRDSPTPISDASYDWKVSTPTFNVNPGTYSTDKTVAISMTTTGATIRYTQNGSEPTESDATVASGGTVSITTSQTLKAKAFKSGMPASNTTSAAYELKVSAITVSPAAGTYTTAQSVTLSGGSTGATIRWTTGPTAATTATPTPSSTAYSSPIAVPTTTTVKAVGFKSGWTDSDVASRTYTMNFGTLDPPTADPATGSYVNSVTVTLSSIGGATIRYTTDGSSPMSTSAVYAAPLAFDVTSTLKAKAYHPDYLQSSDVTRTYTLAASAPAFSPTAGTYVAGQLVTLTSSSVSATMRYTINGAEPTTSDPVLASGSTLVVGNYTLKAKAWKTGADASATTTATYSITGEVAPPVLAVGGDSALAIRSDGTAWGWGANVNGQLGDSTTTSPRLLPQLVSGITGALGLSAGGNFSHILLAGGSVAGFGGNTNGRLGDGTTTARLLATNLTGLSAVVAVDGGEDHGIALKGDGTVLTWGANAYGQLGNNTTAQSTSPATVSGITSASAVSAAYHYSLALKQDGTIWSWGDNSAGNLGVGSTTDSLTPAAVSSISTATKVSAGQSHALALLGDGTVMAWGRNVEGQIGDGTTTQRNAPVAVGLLTDVIAVAAGGDVSIALKDDGSVWTWGGNNYGQLADGTTTDRSSAAQVSGLTDIVQIVAGDGFALALASDASVWAWGKNNAGQLGDGTTTNQLTPVQIAAAGMSWRVATPILSLAAGQYVATQSVTVTIADPAATLRYTTTGVDPTSSDATVASGGSLSIDVSQTLKVSGWKTGAPTSVVVARAYELKVVTPTMTPGAGAYGSSPSVAITTSTGGATVRYTTDGTEPTTSSTSYTGALTIADTLTLKARGYKTGWTPSDSGYAGYSVSAGTVATPMLAPGGGAQTTPPLVSMTTATPGAIIRYTLDGSTPGAHAPVFVYPFLVTATTTVTAKAFKAGYTPSATASTTFDVDAAGATATPSMVPIGGTYAIAQTVTITGASGATLRYTTNGSDPTTASTSITSGDTINVSASAVVKVRAWASGLEPSALRRADFVITGALSAGNTHSMALASSGAVWTWGTGGVIGDGNFTAELTPVLVLTGGAAIAMGTNHALVAKVDGSVWAWGDATNGRVGNGSAAGYVTTPAPIASFGAVTAVATGGSHSLALKSDGTVWSFGKNAHGQLGDGTTTDRTTPIQVVGLTGIVSIAAGRDTSYAVQTDSAGGGLVWAWGANGEGQVGDGSLVERRTPVGVVGLSNVVQVSSSSNASSAIALLADGTVYGWGANGRAQLGLGHTTNQATAQPILGLAHIRAIAEGGEYGVAADALGRVWGWGDDTSGQLAQNVTQTEAVIAPVQSDVRVALFVSAGTGHTLAASPDGTVTAVGVNSGRLGNGGTASSASPVTVSGLTLADNTWLTGDADGDALPTWREYLLGTDPLNPDSNGNGILDGADEGSGLNPSNPDVDDDGVPNWMEQLNGTDPFNADSDGDSVSDANDAFPLDPTRSLAPSSNPSDITPPVVTLKAPVSARLVP